MTFPYFSSRFGTLVDPGPEPAEPAEPVSYWPAHKRRLGYPPLDGGSWLDHDTIDSEALDSRWKEIDGVGFRHETGMFVYSYVQVAHDRDIQHITPRIREIAQERLDEQKMAVYYGLTVKQFRKLKEEGS